MAALMNEPESIMDVQSDDDIYLVIYQHPSNEQVFKNEIKSEGDDRVVWGNYEGRY